MGEGWSDAQFADAAMYVVSRDRLASVWRSARKEDWKDADVEQILKSYLEVEQEPEASETSTAVQERKVLVVGNVLSENNESNRNISYCNGTDIGSK